MQNTNTKTTSAFSSIRITLFDGAEKVKAMASCLVGNAIMITGIRLVEGKFGLFMSMPQRKNNTTGEYVDVAFPISKEMREELSQLVIDEFERVAHESKPLAAAA